MGRGWERRRKEACTDSIPCWWGGHPFHPGSGVYAHIPVERPGGHEGGDGDRSRGLFMEGRIVGGDTQCSGVTRLPSAFRRSRPGGLPGQSWRSAILSLTTSPGRGNPREEPWRVVLVPSGTWMSQLAAKKSGDCAGRGPHCAGAGAQGVIAGARCLQSVPTSGMERRASGVYGWPKL